jgi:hypothetical protein
MYAIDSRMLSHSSLVRLPHLHLTNSQIRHGNLRRSQVRHSPPRRSQASDVLSCDSKTLSGSSYVTQILTSPQICNGSPRHMHGSFRHSTLCPKRSQVCHRHPRRFQIWQVTSRRSKVSNELPKQCQVHHRCLQVCIGTPKCSYVLHVTEILRGTDEYRYVLGLTDAHSYVPDTL